MPSRNRQVRIFSNTSWVWESSDPSWLTGVDEGLEQNDNQVFTYKVTQNNNSGSRTADLVFTTTSGNVIATLTVTQLGGPGTAGLAVAPDPLDPIGPDAAELSVEVLTDKAWQWVSNDSWLTSQVANPQSGSQTFAFNASENVTWPRPYWHHHSDHGGG